VSFEIVSPRETLACSFGIFAPRHLAPETLGKVGGLWMYLSAVAFEVFLVHETLVHAGWHWTLERSSVSADVLIESTAAGELPWTLWTYDDTGIRL